jgi:hypothetical protein
VDLSYIRWGNMVQVIDTVVLTTEWEERGKIERSWMEYSVGERNEKKEKESGYEGKWRGKGKGGRRRRKPKG